MITIDETLVKNLIAAQFPQWKHLPIKAVVRGGWDNRTFHLGDRLSVRMPSAAVYAAKVDKEHRWLPILAPLLPLPISQPVVMGTPGCGYPWKWSVYRWLEGNSAASVPITDLSEFARSLAQFLTVFQQLDTTGGPVAGEHNFYRGGALSVYDDQTQHAITVLADKIDTDVVTEMWQLALATQWHGAPVWVHGDVSSGNLLVQDGQLSAVIDFGGLAIGDPACDLAIAWTLFHGKSRNLFRENLALDDDTWARGRAWTLWKALIIAAGLTETNAVEGERCWRIIHEIVTEYKAPICL